MEIYNLFGRKNAIEDITGITALRYIEEKYKMMSLSTAYHYTDISGFIGIIENTEFWLSHIKFMNDKLEYLEGKAICEKVIAKLLPTQKEDVQDLLNELMLKLNENMSSGFMSRSSKDVFSISFSRNRDSLDMWRGYGNNSGIAIGFDVSKSFESQGFSMMRKEQYESEVKLKNGDKEKMTAEHEFMLFPTNVIYVNEDKEKIVLELIEMGIEHYKYRQRESLDIAKISAIHYLSDCLFYFLPFLKNKGFINENECRIVQNAGRYTEEVPLKLYFRERNSIVLPFIKYSLLDRNCRTLKQWPISEIVIGPGLKQKELAESVRYFLSRQGMYDIINKVVLSEIPFVPNSY